MEVPVTFKMKRKEEKTRLRETAEAVDESMSEFIRRSLEIRYAALPKAMRNVQKLAGGKCVGCKGKGK